MKGGKVKDEPIGDSTIAFRQAISTPLTSLQKFSLSLSLSLFFSPLSLSLSFSLPLSLSLSPSLFLSPLSLTLSLSSLSLLRLLDIIYELMVNQTFMYGMLINSAVPITPEQKAWAQNLEEALTPYITKDSKYEKNDLIEFCSL
jgi:hypothetical protein